MDIIIAGLTLLALAFIQNVASSLSSRSRNRGNTSYHIFAAGGSNVIWFITFKHILTHDMSWALLIPYTIGTVAGSVFGVKASMWIEKKFNITADGHIKESNSITKTR